MGSPHAQDVAPPDRDAIRGVIARQLEAFRRDDGAAAFGLASPGIQGQFGDADRFLDMVRRAYPPVHRPRSVEFTELVVKDGEIVQQVELTGPDGKPALALYSMERDDAGQWRISGCVLVRSTRVGV
ncbi:MAG: DUF4864 domain-containing protein [Gemmatimonadaceae bacterium]|nr:DUF4864 domain-containing protein [Acetobacteraceae bacterium]